MENASQALVIAGSILLAILTLSLFAYMFNNMSIMQNAKADKKMAQDIANWNLQWEAYNKQYLYGLDVLTVINKADENNKYYNNSEQYKVSVKVEGQVANESFAIKSLLKGDNKTEMYTCVKVSYNQETGRVNEMRFEITI